MRSVRLRRAARFAATAAIVCAALACGVKGAPRAPRAEPVTPAPAAGAAEPKPTSTVQPPPVDVAPENAAPKSDAGTPPTNPAP